MSVISAIGQVFRRLRKEEDGVTMTELVMGMFVGVIVMVALFAMIDLANRGTNRTTARVDANQRARPAVTLLIDRLRSSCVSEGLPPIQAGSDGNTVSYLHADSPNAVIDPDIRQVTYGSESISESIYPSTGGSTPYWTFATSPSETRELITKVEPVDDGGTPVPVFRYYAYASGVVDPTPLPTPLSAADAARTVQVDVALTVSPNQNPTRDAGAEVTLRDSAVMRLSAASQDPSQENLPCL